MSRLLPVAFIAPCLPTLSTRVPAGSHWVHEIKHDGYRLMVRHQAARVRLFTRRGFDWSNRFPRIVEAVAGLPVRSLALDGEAVVCGEDGMSDFDRLHSNGWDAHVVLYAFDLLELNGTDWRAEPLGRRKEKLADLLAGAADGVRLTEHFDGDGAVMFKHACAMGLEGIVSKRRDYPYRSGRTKDWIKVKNPTSPAALRLQDGTW